MEVLRGGARRKPSMKIPNAPSGEVNVKKTHTTLTMDLREMKNATPLLVPDSAQIYTLAC